MLVRNRYLLGRRLLWQAGCSRAVVAAEVAVLELNPRVLSSWAVLLARRTLRRPTVLWGHAFPRAGREARSDRVRGLMRRWPMCWWSTPRPSAFSFRASPAARAWWPRRTRSTRSSGLHRREQATPSRASSSMWAGSSPRRSHGCCSTRSCRARPICPPTCGSCSWGTDPSGPNWRHGRRQRTALCSSSVTWPTTRVFATPLRQRDRQRVSGVRGALDHPEPQLRRTDDPGSRRAPRARGRGRTPRGELRDRGLRLDGGMADALVLVCERTRGVARAPRELSRRIAPTAIPRTPRRRACFRRSPG